MLLRSRRAYASGNRPGFAADCRTRLPARPPTEPTIRPSFRLQAIPIYDRSCPRRASLGATRLTSSSGILPRFLLAWPEWSKQCTCSKTHRANACRMKVHRSAWPSQYWSARRPFHQLVSILNACCQSFLKNPGIHHNMHSGSMARAETMLPESYGSHPNCWITAATRAFAFRCCRRRTSWACLGKTPD
jgi:hypothetical protein